MLRYNIFHCGCKLYNKSTYKFWKVTRVSYPGRLNNDNVIKSNKHISTECSHRVVQFAS